MSVASLTEISEVDYTLAKNDARYGHYPTTAAIIQQIKHTFRDTPNWVALTPYQQESLDMVAHKIGRILSGDPFLADSWHDIEGYIRLVNMQLRAPGVHEK